VLKGALYNALEIYILFPGNGWAFAQYLLSFAAAKQESHLIWWLSMKNVLCGLARYTCYIFSHFLQLVGHLRIGWLARLCLIKVDLRIAEVATLHAYAR
jgi:hypothetical protein